MAPVYSGSLPPKKKQELQEIALALRISDQGTKEDLVQRITKHLDTNQDVLEENNMFAGLYRRRRSVQPPLLTEKPKSSRISALQAIEEATPVKELRHVSTYLKQSSPVQSPSSHPPKSQANEPVLEEIVQDTVLSPSISIIERLPDRQQVTEVVTQFSQENVRKGGKLLTSLRYFLSNSRNIWLVSAILEVNFILTAIIPWKTYQLPLSPSPNGISYPLRYPPLSVLQTPTFWLVLLHWALPALVLPALVGCLITFNPTLAPNKGSHSRHPVAPLDPLTASIVRLAAQVGYPYTMISLKSDIVGLDVLGSNLRILSAAVGLAFAFSEAISGAPQTVVSSPADDRSLIVTTRRNSDDSDRQLTPPRRSIMPNELANEID